MFLPVFEGLLLFVSSVKNKPCTAHGNVCLGQGVQLPCSFLPKAATGFRQPNIRVATETQNVSVSAEKAVVMTMELEARAWPVPKRVAIK
jgi:hypothetical protein